ncbi:peptidylprolyl isomerase [Botrimarina sp.]|uniref:peptidylprolyl isomerase n=1 Tax=Botrimarina sp. TaxID=2795802 RepID=UPI0032EFCA2B
MRRRQRSGRLRTAERLEDRLAMAVEAIGDPIQLNSLLADEQLAEGPAAVAASDAGYAVVYEGRGPVDRDGVFFRRLSLEGATLGPAVRVNTTLRGAQHSPAVAMADDGSAVVVWAGRGVGDKQGVFLQRYDTSGAAVGGETLVNSVTGGLQTDPSVALLDDGTIVVAWHGAMADDAVGVGMRRFGADGAPLGPAARVNTQAGSDQQNASVAALAGGGLVVGWQSRHQDGDSWGVYAQRYDAAGAAAGGESRLTETTAGSQAGVALAGAPDGGYVAAWQSHAGASADWDVVARGFTAAGAAATDQTPLAAAAAGRQTGVAIAALEDGQWLAAWNSTPTDAAAWSVAARTVEPGQSSDAETPLAPAADAARVAAGARPSVAATDGAALVAYGGVSGVDRRGVIGQRVGVELADNGTPAAPDLAEVADRTVAEGFVAEVTLIATDANPRDTLTFSLDADNSPAGATIEQTGAGTAVVRWTPPAGSDGQSFSFRVLVTDDGDTPLADAEDFTLTVDDNVDLVALARAISDSGAQFFGAAWCPFCTDQKELFDDGGQFLPFREVTGPDRTPNDLAEENEIENYPTWVFADGTRVERVMSPAELAAAAGVTATVADGPFLVEPADTTLLVGSPLHVSLDGYSPSGGPLTYTVQSDNPDVSAEILSGNRSLRIDMQGYGDMVFELFDDRAPRATSRVATLAAIDFYDDLTFHRVIDNFVIQGGDPDGDGTGGSPLANFDDQYHPDLQHNRSGLLSYAKSADDTNDSQFFITEGAQRGLDFNHTVFGVLVEGEDVRAAISDTETGANNRPTNTIRMETAEVFTDTENAVLLLKAADGATGSANLTVTVEDQQGRTSQRTFRVDLAADSVDNRPYFSDIAPVTAPAGSPAEFQLPVVDIDGGPTALAARVLGGSGATATVSDTGLVSVTPPAGFTGTVNVEVRVASTAAQLADSPVVGQLNVDVQVVGVTFG